MAAFIIVDSDKNYLMRDSNGKYVTVKKKSLAEVFPEMWKAKKVLNNNITPKKRKYYHISECITVDDKLDECVLDKMDNDRSDDSSGRGADYSSYLNKYKKEIDNLRALASEIETRKKELSDQLSNTDKEIIDIQHYIEFNVLEDKGIIETYNMLKERLQNRRSIKNELNVLRQLNECKIDIAMIDLLFENIKEIDNKSYSPRVLTCLFNQ